MPIYGETSSAVANPNTCMETNLKDVICLNDKIVTSNVVAWLTGLAPCAH